MRVGLAHVTRMFVSPLLRRPRGRHCSGGCLGERKHVGETAWGEIGHTAKFSLLSKPASPVDSQASWPCRSPPSVEPKASLPPRPPRPSCRVSSRRAMPGARACTHAAPRLTAAAWRRRHRRCKGAGVISDACCSAASNSSPRMRGIIGEMIITCAGEAELVERARARSVTSVTCGSRRPLRIKRNSSSGGCIAPVPGLFSWSSRMSVLVVVYRGRSLCETHLGAIPS